jgi:hypothetical protein
MRPLRCTRRPLLYNRESERGLQSHLAELALQGSSQRSLTRRVEMVAIALIGQLFPGGQQRSVSFDWLQLSDTDCPVGHAIKIDLGHCLGGRSRVADAGECLASNRLVYVGCH